ncbi:GxxExxY protein [Malonomonas rubra DSM 5091]|uniref:GxxExxY protein n=1 Tax=Malonomonas rubra DSM 5091 TaxID=1122189 RepID=A0A1M6KCX4_MALRU|nr:GxxExxY protein [Malonomonas rubra]SHJ56762.1 GxxExxY protein [Malonomonas rubra DSM 5091]
MGIDDITYRINGAIYEVNRVLGHGFLEKVYEKALLHELRECGLKAESQVPIPVSYKGFSVGDYFADIVVEGKVLLELKSVKVLDKSHEAQLLNYLKATNIPIGLLINFTFPKAVIKRFVS